MSRLNLDNLIALDAGLSKVWAVLASWLDHHQSTKFIDVRRLARELREPSTIELAEAMDILARNGIVRRVYRVESPEGDLLNVDYQSPTDVPTEVYDRWEKRKFPTAQGTIVSGFELEAAK